ncbi:MAG: 30S ribosomal protein S16 [Cytophagales bacterium]|nr:MAG: 30S ribosomal protein S16 [Cytophagales bacterium]
MVKMRLARRGRKKLAIFDIVIATSRSPRDGRFIEKLGVYNPNSNPATIEFDENKAFDWLMKGAQPTDTMRRILSYKGVMFRKHLQVGVNKGAISQEQADAKLAAWKGDKEAQVLAKIEKLAGAKVGTAKAKLEAETKVKEARSIAIQKKAQVVVPQEEVAASEGENEEQA